ncbi:MAG: HdaA/DnaA family protein, partial [Moraxellaceae bacterium]
MPAESTPVASMPAEQLLLAVRPRPDARLADFAGPAYAPLLAAVGDCLRQPASLLYVHGPAGHGRSHLLAALCVAAEAEGLPAMVLPLPELVACGPGVLEGIEGPGLLALDDIEAVAGHPAWEEGLFHLVNRQRGAGGRLVFSAAAPPRQLGLGLPDLVSRLAQAPVWAMPLPDEASHEALIEAASRRRGWVLEPAARRYLALRLPRAPGRLLACLEQIDRASLASG